MIRIVMTVAAIMACVVLGWSQDYYEASGQPAVFTLAAGAKAGPLELRLQG